MADENPNTQNISRPINTISALPKSVNPKKKPIRKNLLNDAVFQTSGADRNSYEGRRSSISFLRNPNNINDRINFPDHSGNPNISDSLLQNLINEAIRNQLSNMGLNQNHNARPSLGNPSRGGQSRTNIRQNRYNTSLDLTADKVSNIISSWKIKFTGEEENGLSVDNFIYRVQALTVQNLRGDFDTLCRHIDLLFSGKANDWYWRFHRTTNQIDWDSLCREMRNQFRDRRTDFDLKEHIRSRKQKVGERFDVFYDTVLQISDRLQFPLEEQELVEILKRNIRPEVRQEQLHFPIRSISELREYVRKHEILEEELYKYRPNRAYNPRKNISEIQTDVCNNDEPINIEEITDLYVGIAPNLDTNLKIV